MKKTYEQGICEGYAKAAEESAQRIAGLEAMTEGQREVITDLENGLEAAQARVAEYERILEGISQDAIDGGWTAKGICAYAKKLEGMVAELEALQPSPASGIPASQSHINDNDLFGVCMLVAEAAYKDGNGHDRSVASDVLRPLVSEVLQSIQPQPAPQEPSVEQVRDAIKTAYGYLWHVNAAQDAPVECNVLSISPEAAAYRARQVLREFLTHEQRGEGINAVRVILQSQAKQTDGSEGL